MTPEEMEYRIKRIESALIELQSQMGIYLGIGVNAKSAFDMDTQPPYWDDVPIDFSKPIIHIRRNDIHYGA